MSPDAIMKGWVEKYGQDPRVLAWLKNNPPPAQWQGTPEEYAYTEMPFFFEQLTELLDEERELRE